MQKNRTLSIKKKLHEIKTPQKLFHQFSIKVQGTIGGISPNDCKTTRQTCDFPAFLFVDGIDGSYSIPSIVHYKKLVIFFCLNKLV